MNSKVFELACLSGGINIIFLETEENVTNEQFNDLCRKISLDLGRDMTVDKIANVLIEKHNFKKIVPDGKFLLL